MWVPVVPDLGGIHGHLSIKEPGQKPTPNLTIRGYALRSELERPYGQENLGSALWGPPLGAHCAVCLEDGTEGGILAPGHPILCSAIS